MKRKNWLIAILVLIITMAAVFAWEFNTALQPKFKSGYVTKQGAK